MSDVVGVDAFLEENPELQYVDCVFADLCGVSGTGSVSTEPTGTVDGGGAPSDGCPITPAFERISTITVTAPSRAAGAR